MSPRRARAPRTLAPAKPPPPEGELVLGIDPGTRAVGWGLLARGPRGVALVDAGVLRPPREAPVPARLLAIRLAFEELLDRVRPSAVAVETAFAARNVQSALRIGEGRGVLLACAAAAGTTIREYPPALVKRTVIGNGRASKPQVAAGVRLLLRRPDLAVSEDAADALAVALTHVHVVDRSARFGQLRDT